MQELMDLLKDYSRSSMMDDFYAIKKAVDEENDNKIIPENEDQKTVDNNNSNINNKSNTHESLQYFQSKLGKCTNFINCKCFERNRRVRSSDSITNERRKAFYIRNEDVQKYKSLSRFEVKEVILQSSLDIIHNYIFHAEDEEMNVNQSHASKFVTDIAMEENDSKSNNNSGKKAKKMGSYSFGVETGYWLLEDPYYVHAKYPDLKTELLKNSFHPITPFAYDTLEEQAMDFLLTKYGQSMKSKREHLWMLVDRKQLIPKGTLITILHLIAVLAYTNHDKMQYEFKRQGFRTKYETERLEHVRKRNSEIAHWSRAIFEVIHCWGSVMSRKRPLFHGINCKLLFDRFSKMFAMPTSLTTNVRVAQNFAKEDGIILVLKHAGEKDDVSLMFDVSAMSDYPNEEERLIYTSRVQFFDILVDGQSYKRWMVVLRFVERLYMGSFLSHIPCSAAQQEMIVCMIENYLEDMKGKSAKNDDFYENGNIPNYIQLLFNNCMPSGLDIFFINSYEIKRAITNEQLLQYLDGSQNGKNSKFLAGFKKMREANVYEWLITGDAYDSLFYGSDSWAVDEKKRRINLAKTSVDEPLFVEFHWEIHNATNGCLSCVLFCDHLPAEVTEVRMNVSVFIKETKSEANFGSDLSHQRLYINDLHSIVESKKLMMENNSDMKKKEFIIKFICASFGTLYNNL